jgi:HSP20 family protein
LVFPARKEYLMAESEIKVKKAPEKETSALAHWPEFDTPFFRGNFFEMNPISLIRRFTQEMDRFYHAPGGVAGIWSPTIEVKEEGGKFKVTAELPGVKSEDVKVQVTGEAVILEGERKSEKEEKREGFYHSERSYGRFYRSIPLPKGADTDKALAEYKDGVLEINIPVPESKTKTREIPVKHAA